MRAAPVSFRASPRVSMTLLLSLTLGGSALAVPPGELGDLIVTELQADPVTRPQYYAEWFEIYNNAGKTLDLNDLLIEREGQSFVITGPPITIGAADYFVLGVNSDVSINGNVEVDYVYAFSGFNITAADDTIRLSYDGVMLDELDWDSSWAIAADNAHACAPNASDNEWANDLSLNWCPSEAFIPESGMFGSPGDPNDYCGDEANQDNDGDGFAEFEGDCNDADVTVNPDAIDGSAAPYGKADDDADCDGVRDDGDTDDDGDGWSEVAGDCDDDNFDAYPGAVEALNGLDDDCNGCVDDVDTDRDGWTTCPVACDSDDDGDIDNNDVPCYDCLESADGGAAYNPDALEIPYDGNDQNCNGSADECDVDGDKYPADSSFGPGCSGYDCNDADAAVHPGAPEDPTNGKDDDCDDVVDIPDRDDDGYTEADGDCMDIGAENGATAAQIVLSQSVNPASTEVCFNQLDDDCDGWIDNGEKCSRAAEFAGVRGGGLCGVTDAGGGLAAAILALAALARRNRSAQRSR